MNTIDNGVEDGGNQDVSAGKVEPTVKDRLLITGVVGTVIAAVCCFTPALVVVLGAIGLSSIVGYLDHVLLPALAVFLIITGYALWRRMTSR